MTKAIKLNNHVIIVNNNTIVVERIYGSALRVDGFIRLLAEAGVLRDICSSDQHRQNAGVLSKTTGMSGRTDFYWREILPVNGVMVYKDHHILHISCEGKINEKVRCYIPDLALVLYEHYRELTQRALSVDPTEYGIKNVLASDEDIQRASSCPKCKFIPEDVQTPRVFVTESGRRLRPFHKSAISAIAE